MKDTTKHLIAKEIYRFFKIAFIGFGLGIIMAVIRFFTFTRGIDWPELYGIPFIIMAWFIVLFYIFTFLRKAYKWVMKWK